MSNKHTITDYGTVSDIVSNIGVAHCFAIHSPNGIMTSMITVNFTTGVVTEYLKQELRPPDAGKRYHSKNSAKTLLEQDFGITLDELLFSSNESTRKLAKLLLEE